jgi:hypothetical protein
MELNSLAQSESCQQTNSIFVITVLPTLPKILYYTAATTEELMAETGLFYAQNSFHYTAQTKFRNDFHITISQICRTPTHF